MTSDPADERVQALEARVQGLEDCVNRLSVIVADMLAELVDERRRHAEPPGRRHLRVVK